MTTCMHKFDESSMIIFVSGKNRPLLLAKRDAWCRCVFCIYGLELGIPRKESSWYFHQLSQKLICLDWFDFFMYTLYAYKRIYIVIIFFHFGNTIFFVGEKITKLETSPHPSPCYKWIANYINLWLWLIDRWNMIFFNLPSAVMF